MQVSEPPCTLLLDCGEGTLAAMRRTLGAAAAQAAVDALVAIFVSHHHADHCLGLPALLQARHAHLKPLVAALPRPVMMWLQEAHAHLLARAQCVPCSDFTGGHFLARAGPAAAPPAAALRAAGFVAWVCPRVRHCHDAFAAVLEHRQGWKLVFSGDTMPSAQLAELGAGATLLMHEATFGDDLAESAARKRHSTVSDALEAAERMRAWRVVLTHFSQRYSKVAPDAWRTGAVRSAAAAAALRRSVPAFDGMVVPFARLHSLPMLAPAMMGFVTESADEDTV